MIKRFGQTYIEFDEYPPYSVRISEMFENNINENIQCAHGHAYSSGKQKICTWVNEKIWGMTKTFFLIQSKKQNPKTVLCKECTYVRKYTNESDENYDST